MDADFPAGQLKWVPQPEKVVSTCRTKDKLGRQRMASSQVGAELRVVQVELLPPTQDWTSQACSFLWFCSFPMRCEHWTSLLVLSATITEDSR